MPHLVRSAQRITLIIVIVALAACGAPALPTPTAAPTGAPIGAPTDAPLVVPTATPAPPATAEAEPTVAPTVAATLPAATEPPPEPAPIFGPAWGDREVYRAGLIASEQSVLDALDGATEYRIMLEIHETLTGVGGQQQVRYTNREAEPLSEVYLRLFPNALGGEMTAYDLTVDGAPVTREYEFERTALRIPLPRPLQPGESVVIGLRYDIEVPETLDEGYGLLGYTDGILALDAPYLPIPVYNDEGWNAETPPENSDTSFNDAGLYLVHVMAPASVTVVATGVAIDTLTRDSVRGEWRETTYALGPARDFSLAASDKYTVATQQAGETVVNSYALTGDEARRDLALEAAVASLETYAARLGPYPYTEFDVSATPMLALGIEYPGAVGISTRVYDAGNADTARALESTVAHEAAHQWFYNIVGSDQIDEPWLDEALAQYATWLYYVDRDGEAAAEVWRDSWGSRWDRLERAEKPVGLPAAEYSAREYSAIVYGRGPLFLTALAERMGQDRFDAFLGEYARAFRWNIATTEDFKQRAEAACACELDDLFDAWLE